VARGERWNWTADFDRAIADGGSSRQVCADSSYGLAARCDGRSDTGLRTDSRGDDGNRRRLHVRDRT